MSQQKKPDRRVELWSSLKEHSLDSQPRIFQDLRLTHPEDLPTTLESLDIDVSSLKLSRKNENLVSAVLYTACSVDLSGSSWRSYPITRGAWELMRSANSHGGNNLNSAARSLLEVADTNPVGFERVVREGYQKLTGKKLE